MDMKVIMYNWRHMEAVHSGISSVEPREPATQELDVISFHMCCNDHMNIYLFPVLLQT
jgi:hypothetical protein